MRGHFKTGHVRRPGTWSFLSRFLLIRQAYFGSPTPRPTFEDMAVVEEAGPAWRFSIAKKLGTLFHSSSEKIIINGRWSRYQEYPTIFLLGLDRAHEYLRSCPQHKRLSVTVAITSSRASH